MYAITDQKLSPKEIEQAKIAANKIKELPYDFVISSPLKRAKKTAQIVNEYQQKCIMYDKRIIERGCRAINAYFLEFQRMRI